MEPINKTFEITAARPHGHVQGFAWLLSTRSKRRHLPTCADPIRALAYHLYTLCERKGWGEDARAYNELVTARGAIESEAAHDRAAMVCDSFPLRRHSHALHQRARLLRRLPQVVRALHAQPQFCTGA